MSWGAHSERSVARTNCILLDNMSQVPDNCIFYTTTTTDRWSARGLGPALRQQSSIGWVSLNHAQSLL